MADDNHLQSLRLVTMGNRPVYMVAGESSDTKSDPMVSIISGEGTEYQVPEHLIKFYR